MKRLPEGRTGNRLAASPHVPAMSEMPGSRPESATSNSPGQDLIQETGP
jgi:hypothetical protein